MIIVEGHGPRSMVGQFFEEKQGAQLSPAFHGVMFVHEEHRGAVCTMDTVGAALGFDYFIGKSAQVHLHIQDRRVFSRRTIRYFMNMAFVQLNRRVLIAPIAASNKACVDLAERLGFSRIGEVPQGALDGSDLRMLQLHISDCRWLKGTPT